MITDTRVASQHGRITRSYNILKSTSRFLSRSYKKKTIWICPKRRTRGRLPRIIFDSNHPSWIDISAIVLTHRNSSPLPAKKRSSEPKIIPILVEFLDIGYFSVFIIARSSIALCICFYSFFFYLSVRGSRTKIHFSLPLASFRKPFRKWTISFPRVSTASEVTYIQWKYSSLSDAGKQMPKMHAICTGRCDSVTRFNSFNNLNYISSTFFHPFAAKRRLSNWILGRR